MKKLTTNKISARKYIELISRSCASEKLFAKSTGIDVVGSVIFPGMLITEPIRNATAIVSPNARPKAKMIEPMIPPLE